MSTGTAVGDHPATRMTDPNGLASSGSSDILTSPRDRGALSIRTRSAPTAHSGQGAALELGLALGLGLGLALGVAVTATALSGMIRT